MRIEGTIKEAAAAASALAATVLVFAPIHVFATNRLEFEFPFRTLLAVCLPAGILAALALSALSALLPGALREKAASVLIALAVLCWIQGNVLVWRYGAFDGRGIDWKLFRWPGIIDIAVWSVLILLALFVSRPFRRHAVRIAAALAAVQLLSTGLDVTRMPHTEGLYSYTFGSAQMAAFSRDRNVLLIMLDAFQGDLFQELIAREPEWKSAFPGFTQFPDAVGGYSNTLFAVPYFLTGRAFDKTSVTDFARRAYERSVTRLLAGHGFDAEIYPLMFDLLYCSPGLASNMIPKTRADPAETAFLFDVALFRSLPQPAKKWVFRDQKWLLKGLFAASPSKAAPSARRAAARKRFRGQQDAYARYGDELVKAMESHADAGARRPTFKYFHLKGLHPPFSRDGECRLRPMEFNRENALNQARCELQAVRRILDGLKKLGIYERTMIFVIGDHGLGSWGLELRSDLYGPARSPGSGNPALSRAMASASPAFLVKPLGAAAGDPFRQSLAPVTLGDIPKTILEALGLPEEAPGASVFEIPEGISRPRPYFDGKVRVLGKGVSEFPREYLIDGPVWLESSWRLVSGPRNP